ncbi:MAG: PKD domain-containing protein [Bacteroidota bacterium]
MSRFFILLCLLFSAGFVYGQCTSPAVGNLDVNPPLTDAGYPEGTVVNMCFTLNSFNPVVINWLHSIIPQFGPGWDVSTLTPVSSPNACAGGSGTWSFYNGWTSCATGINYGPGFAFESPANVGCGGTNGQADADPGNNWGDSGNCPRTFCWEITAGPNPNSGCSAADYIVQVFSYGDAESGNYNPPGGPPCLNDEPLCWPEVENLTATVDMPCPGDDFTLTANADEIPCGSDIVWEGPNGFTANGLVVTTNQEGLYTITVSSPGCADAEATVNATYGNFNPTLDISPGNQVCEGDQVTISISSGNTFEFVNPSGSVVQNGPNSSYTFTATPDDTGEWVVNIIGGTAACAETLMTDLLVDPLPVVDGEANPDPVCTGDIINFSVINPDITVTYEWDGGLFTGENYTITAPAPGSYFMQLEGCSINGCCETIDIPYTVLGLPNVNVTANPPAICEFDQVTITASGGVTYNWNPDPANTTGPTFTDSPSSSTTYNVTVTDANGCIDIGSVDVDVQEELPAPQVSCESNTAATLDFDWPPVPGADFYEIYIDGVLQPQNQPPVNLTGLTPLQNVTIRVIPFSNNNASCPGQETELTCQVADCDPVIIDIDPIDPICADGNNDPIDLVAGVNAAGQLTWSGPGVVSIPGQNPGLLLPNLIPPGSSIITITATFTLFDGSCPFSETIDIEILEGASAEIDVSENDVCIDQTVTVELADSEVFGATYTWDYGGATLESGTGNAGPFTLSFPGPGDYTVTLETANGNCISMGEQTITVQDTLDPITVFCQAVTNSSITFGWNDNGADEYEVTVIGGATTTQTGNTFEVTGLSNGDFVSIQVTAVSNGLCPSVTSNVQECQALACPDVTIDIDQPAQSFCNDGNNDPLDLTATISGATNPSAISWAGPGVSGATFDADDAGVGTHTITASITDEGCPFTASVVFTVNELPTSDFTLSTDVTCIDSLITVTYTGTADAASSTFNWDFDGGVEVSGSGVGPYEISWPTAADVEIRLTVIDSNNCSSTETIRPAEVQNPLPAPVVECVDLALDMVTFQWADVPGATGYDVVLVSGPAGTQNGNTYTVSGLDEGDQVTIRVTTLGNGPCGNSASTEATCEAQSCPDITAVIDNPPADYCQDGMGTFEQLSPSAIGSMVPGTFVWSGPGVSNDTFFVDDANLGPNTITLTYTEEGCTYDTFVVFTVFELPTADFTISPDTVCISDTVTVTYTGTAGTGANFDWDLGGLDSLSGTSAGSFQIVPASGGDFSIQLVVTENGCSSASQTESFFVEEPLATPDISCIGADLDEVTFGWDAVAGADSFQVTVTPGGSTFFQDSLSLTIGGLNEGDDVTIEVIAFGSGVCGNSEVGMQTCTASSCPPLFVTPTPAETSFCLGDGSTPLVLTADTGGGVGGGDLSWTGTGVSQNGADYIFDDEVAGLGDHWVFATYAEGGCSVTDSVLMMVFEIPTAQIVEANGEMTFCTDQTITLSYQGSGTVGTATFDWDFDGAATESQPDPSQEIYELTYNAPGTYTVTLTVTENGCASDQATYELIITEPLGQVDASCGDGGLNEATVEWTYSGTATQFEIAVDGVVVDTVSASSYTQGGLMPGEAVDFSITPITLTDPCGDGDPIDITCNADPCPDLSIDLPADPVPICVNADPLVLSETIINGSGGVVTWSGTGVSGNAFDPSVAGEGTFTLVVDYSEAGPCTLQDSFEVEVLPLPTADFTLSATEVCTNEAITVAYNGTAAAGATYEWDFADGDTISGTGQGPFEISFPTAGPRTISLQVTENGCEGPSFSLLVDVLAPLDVPVIECTNEGLEEVTFSWDAIDGATGYEIVVLGSGEVSTQTETTFTIDGLGPDETVSISVQALGDAPCGDGDPVEASCTTLSCPDITVTSVTPAQSFCLADNSGSVLLEATSNGGDMTGTFTWSGQGVEQVGSDYFFNPDVAGLGTWTLTIDYEETAGCTGTGTLEMSVVPVPEADFMISADPICVGEEVTVTYTGVAGPNAVYDWDFGTADFSGTGAGPYTVSYAQDGVQTIGLRVTEGGCENDTTIDLTVVAPLANPEPSCSGASLTNITISWPAVDGATGYLVTTSEGDNEVVTGTIYEVDGLEPGQEVTFTVVAQGPPPCGDSDPVTVSCFTETCPDLTISPSAAETVFCSNATEQELLTAAITGGAGSEVAIWSGTGVVSVGSDFFFDPTGLPAGDYVLTAAYNEGGVCPYSAQLTMTINSQPIADFSLSESLVCENGVTVVDLGGVVAPGATIEWDFDGATVVDLGNERYELSYPNSGSYTIDLTIVQSGCQDATSQSIDVEAGPVAGSQSVELARCPDDNSPSNLFDLLSGADAGGAWSAEPGTPSNSIDPATGQLNAGNLNPGEYSYRYTLTSPTCGEVSAVVDITIQPTPVADAGLDQSLTCLMGMVSLDGSGSDSGPGFTYEWTDESGDPVIGNPNSVLTEVSQGGTYTLRVTSPIGCTATDEVLVRADTEVPIPQVDLSNISCFSDSDGAIQITDIDGGTPPFTYTLNGQQTDNSGFFPGLDAGEYELRVTGANGCFSELFLDITEPDELSVSLAVSADPDEEIEAGDQVVVTARISGGNAIDTLIWAPDSLNNSPGEANSITFIADETTQITLTVVDELGCRATDNLLVVVRKDRPIFVPNAISPNGDNFNDEFIIYADDTQVEEIESFLIFNRWGETVFENYGFQPNDPAQGWDGTHRGEPLNPAVFVYQALVRFTDGERILYKGDVTLLR